MEWWQTGLLYVGVWLLGFFTGVQAGVASALRKVLVPPTAPPAASGTPDLAAMSQLLGLMKGTQQ